MAVPKDKWSHLVFPFLIFFLETKYNDLSLWLALNCSVNERLSLHQT